MKLIKVLVFLICMFTVIPISYANNESSSASTITVHGNSIVTATPDQATIDIGITNSARTANIAEQQNAVIATNIRAKLIDLGIEEDKIVTTRYTFYPTYNNDNNKTTEIVAYQVNNTISVTIDDIAKIGALIDASIQSGANTINSIDFTIKNDKRIKQQALQGAVQDARAKAEIISKALDKRIVNVLSATETSTSVGSHNFSRLMLKDSLSATTPINPGNINATADVDVVFEIQ
ncbi:SIMPL domain-containing protein [Anaerosinus massiliensis]|uniref:SIMPL domain-containing protein n=1 Tax=Massilibacillus massiliensis TaxID=1806837 RepID=UPI000DA634FD|nr:SIMPL domain-containing protein [Massilibacillus massiliensis]